MAAPDDYTRFTKKEKRRKCTRSWPEQAVALLSFPALAAFPSLPFLPGIHGPHSAFICADWGGCPSIAVLLCPPLSITVLHCPLLSITVLRCPSLSSTICCCPSLSFAVHHCPLLSSTVLCCPSLSSTVFRCPLLSFAVHHCPSLSITVLHSLLLSITVLLCPSLSSSVHHLPSLSITVLHASVGPSAFTLWKLEDIFLPGCSSSAQSPQGGQAVAFQPPFPSPLGDTPVESLKATHLSSGVTHAHCSFLLPRSPALGKGGGLRLRSSHVGFCVRMETWCHSTFKAVALR